MGLGRKLSGAVKGLGSKVSKGTETLGKKISGIEKQAQR